MRNDLFWKKAARSLPEPYRSRYASHFASAERWERAIDECAVIASRAKALIARPFRHA